jgi:hypothetical protein
MKIKEIIKGVLPIRRRFMSESDVKAFLRDKYHNSSEAFLEAASLLIFFGLKQKTWLIATNEALYCVFDINTEEMPRVKWRLSAEKIGSGLSIVVQDYSERTGHVTIGSKNRRKYSRELFTHVPIKTAIRAMLHRSLGVPAKSAA